MRSFVLAALAAATFGFFGAQAASAAKWQEQILGVPTYDSEPVTHADRSERVERSGRRSSRSRRSARRSDGAETRRHRKRRSASRRTRKSGGSHRRSGLASYYWQPQRVASGGWFNPNALTAAHKTLPFGTRVRVTNLRNGRSVVVRINDRGPYVRGRVIDLSRRAAQVVGMTGAGVVPVSISRID